MLALTTRQAGSGGAYTMHTDALAVEGDGLWASKDVGQSWELAMDRPFEPAPRRCADLVCRRSRTCR